MNLSKLLQDRVRRKSLLSKVVEPDSLIPFFKNGMYMGWSGFTGVGYPKVMPVKLAGNLSTCLFILQNMLKRTICKVNYGLTCLWVLLQAQKLKTGTNSL